MRNLILLLFIAFLLDSCISVNKLIKRGKYDEAIELALEKVDRRKIKTKHVLALEDAFYRANTLDLQKAERLNADHHPSEALELYEIYSSILDRQQLIHRILPLRSKDGYQAQLTFFKAGELRRKAGYDAATYLYDKATDLLKKGKQGNKEAAREAKALFLSCDRYSPGFKDAELHARSASKLGRTNVLIEVLNESQDFIPRQYVPEILGINLGKLNTKWVRYHTFNKKDINFDVTAKVIIESVDVSPEREEINHFEDKKRVKDGKKYVLDSNGNVKKDSLGNDIKEDRFKEAVAYVTQVVRTKSARVVGKVLYYDWHTDDYYRTNPIEVISTFEDHSCQIEGDRRALKSEHEEQVKTYPASFPSDMDLIMQSNNELKRIITNEIKSNIF